MLLSEVATTGPDFFFLVPWIVFFPLIGLLINLIFGGRMSEKAIGAVASIASGLTFVVAVLLIISLQSHHEGTTVLLAEWITIGDLHIEWAFRVDMPRASAASSMVKPAKYRSLTSSADSRSSPASMSSNSSIAITSWVGSDSTTCSSSSE